MNEDYIITYVKENFPTKPTQAVANHLRLTVSQVRTIAKRYQIKKCDKYLQGLKKQLVINRKT
ncbi:MAG TPA: hypothetical protein VK067_00865, partial [Pseudogracilibacillus sp.]|nr:hypothetical protein [Pseudogracilibacillus sp.]